MRSPIDWEGWELAAVAAGGAAEVDLAVAAARRAFPQWAALWDLPGVASTSRRSPRRSTLRSRRWPPSSASTTARCSRRCASACCRARRQQHPLLRRLRRASAWRSRRARCRAASATACATTLRRGRGLDAVERAVDARDLARRAGAGRRQHRRAQAAGVGAADLLDARRSGGGRRPAGRACSTSSTAAARRPARR